MFLFVAHTNWESAFTTKYYIESGYGRAEIESCVGRISCNVDWFSINVQTDLFCPFTRKDGLSVLKLTRSNVRVDVHFCIGKV